MIQVIIVDDEILARIGIQSLLEKESDILVKSNFERASDALDYLENNQYIDVVITDIEMVELHGLEFIQKLQQKKLAKGTIICSCHDNFEYAREALKYGANAYILKQELSEELLVKEIRKIYNKENHVGISEKYTDFGRIKKSEITHNSTFAVGTLKFKEIVDEAGAIISSDFEESMLVSVLENIINRYSNGTLFVPYNRDMFVLFGFEENISLDQCNTIIKDIVHDLYINIKNYVNRPLVIGISRFFSDLTKLEDYYKQAIEAMHLSFYDQKEYVYYYEVIQEVNFPNITFDMDEFFSEGNESIIIDQIYSYLQECNKKRINVSTMKQFLYNQINIQIESALKGYNFANTLSMKWNQEFGYNNIFDSSDSINRLVKKIKKSLKHFKQHILYEKKNTELQKTYQFIDENIENKIALDEIASINHMSTASFCKKFKTTTGMTLVQYINSKRIEKVKLLLKENTLSLTEIAEKVGFSNENYLIRVFKKTTGKTITEYRLKD